MFLFFLIYNFFFECLQSCGVIGYERSSLICANGKLYYRSRNILPALFLVLSTELLTEEGVVMIDGSGSVSTQDLSFLNFPTDKKGKDRGKGKGKGKSHKNAQTQDQATETGIAESPTDGVDVAAFSISDERKVPDPFSKKKKESKSDMAKKKESLASSSAPDDEEKKSHRQHSDGDFMPSGNTMGSGDVMSISEGTGGTGGTGGIVAQVAQVIMIWMEEMVQEIGSPMCKQNSCLSYPQVQAQAHHLHLNHPRERTMRLPQYSPMEDFCILCSLRRKERTKMSTLHLMCWRFMH